MEINNVLEIYKRNQSVLSQIKTSCFLEGMVNKQQTMYFWQMMRRDDRLKKIMFVGKAKGSRMRK